MISPVNEAVVPDIAPVETNPVECTTPGPVIFPIRPLALFLSCKKSRYECLFSNKSVCGEVC